MIRTVGKRSPVLGYNHNFKHRGLIFHVQTEDSGVDNPHLFTHLFHGGVIISSRRMDYDADSEVDIVKSLMQSQHKAVLKDLKIGTFDDKIDLYLGSNHELLPRKGDEAEASAPAARVRLDATIADLGPPAAMPPEISDSSFGDTEDISGAAQAAAAAYLQQAAGGSARDSAIPPPPPPRERVMPPIQRPDMLPGPAMHLDIPSTSHSRPRVPTPLATHAITSDHQLGDPMVTFAPPRPPAQRIAPQGQPPLPPGPPPVPQRSPMPPLSEGVPTPVDGVGESSGAYSMRRAKPPTAEQIRTQTPAPPRSRKDPTPAKSFPAGRASGKAANPQPGRPRSSVVVSRPAVIIGAPPNVIGEKGKHRAPTARKARDGNLFGKDLISEKSLDEVIMAYLSEDSS